MDNETPMQKFMREKARQEHRQMIEEYARKGFDKGYNLYSYMYMMDMLNLTEKDYNETACAFNLPDMAETYTEICEDFINCTDANIRAHENIVFVDPVKYKINNEQYIRIFKTPLSIEGELFALVKPVEHKLSKETYFELAKIAVCAEHYLARTNLDNTKGPVYARQMALINPDFLEPGQYKEVCRLAAHTNYRALKWMDYDRLSKQDFIDVFMATATRWKQQTWKGMNPAVFHLKDSYCSDWLRKDCYTAFAEKYGFRELELGYERFVQGTNVHPNEIDHGMLSDVKYRLGFRSEQKPETRKFTIIHKTKPQMFEFCCDCNECLENCPVYKYLDSFSLELRDWNTMCYTDNVNQIPQHRVEAKISDNNNLKSIKRKIKHAVCSCKFSNNR